MKFFERNFGSRLYCLKSFQLVVFTLFFFSPADIFAVTKYWTGTGTWNATNANWSTTSGGTYNQTFNTGDDAVFEGTAGTVTVSAPNNPASITFNVASYVLSGGTITLNSNPTIITATQSATINSILGGAVAMTKNGANALTLAGANTFTGGLTLSAGTLNINHATALGTGAFTISGGTIDNTSGSTVTCSNNNTVNFNATVTYTGTGGATLDLGTGTLGDPADRTFTINGGVLKVGGQLWHNRNMTKNGAGELYLYGPGSVNYGGFDWIYGFNCSVGTLTFAGASTGNIGAGNLDVQSGCVLNINNNEALGLAGVKRLNVKAGGILGNSSGGSVTLTNNNLWDIAGNFTFQGPNDLNMGTGTVTYPNGTNSTITSSAGNLTIGSVLGGTNTLTKAGAGTLTLSGSNTYTGLTTVSAGTLKLGAAGGATNTPLGTTAAGTSVTAGAVLDLNGYSLGTAEALTLNGTGVSSGGALTNSSASAATYTGAITLGSASSIVASSGNINLTTGGITGAYGLTLDGTSTGSTITSVIATGAGTVTKSGTGTWTLSGDNTYTGLTTVSVGTLKLGATGGGTNTPLGTTGAGTVVSATGAALDLAGYTLGTAEALTLNGTGVSSGGALTNSSASAVTYTGAITLGSASSIVASSGDINLTTGGITGAFGLTLDGTSTGSAITSVIGTGAGTVTKSGTGTWTLSGDNTYTGLTTVSAGKLKLGATGGGTNTPLGTTGAGTVVSATGATLDLAGYTLGTAEALTLNGTGVSSGGALMNSGAAVTYSGLVTLGSTGVSIVGETGTIALSNVGTITGSGYNLTLGGAQGGSIASIIGTGTGTLTKNDAGTWTLSGANTYSGGTTINAGILAAGNNSALGSGSISTTGTASPYTILQINNGITLTGMTLTMNSNSTGTLRSELYVPASATASWSGGTITLAGTYWNHIKSDGAFTVSGTINGSCTRLLPRGNGTGTISASISIGSTQMYKTDNGTWTISSTGNTWGATQVAAGTLKMGATNAIPTSTALTIGQSTNVVTTTFDLNGYATTITGLTQATGIISGAHTVTNTGAAATLTINNTSDYTYDSTITNGASALNIIKSGTGTQTFSGNNSYTGTTTISAGTLKLGAAGGGTNTPLGTTAGGTTISATGAALDLNGFSLGTSEGLTLNGTGVSSGGALTNSSSSAATYTGAIVLGSASSLVASSGNINLTTGGITGAYGLTLDGTSTGSTITSVIATGAGTLTKSGTGTWTLSGANTYTGATAVNAGTLAAGVVSVANTSGAFGNNSAVTMANVASTALNITGYNTQIGSLTGGGITGGNVTLGAATLTVGGNNTSPAAYAGVISGSGALTKIGTGTLILSGSSTYTGLTTISAGKIKLGSTGFSSNSPLGTSGAGTSVTSGAALDLGGYTLTIAEALTLNGTGVTSGGALMNSGAAATYSGLVTLGSTGVSIIGGTGTIALSHTGTITGSGYDLTLGGAQGGSIASIIGTGAGTLTKQDAGTWALSGSSTYTGTTTISAGTLQIGNAGSTGALSTSSSIVNNATLAFNRTNTLTQGTHFKSVISGTGAVTQNGKGIVNLSGANTYSGTTTVNTGTLNLTNTAGSSATGSGAVTNAGGVLGGTGEAIGNVTISSGSLSPGTNNLGIIKINGALALSSGATFLATLNGSTAGSYSQVYDTGTVDLASATLSLTLGYVPTAGQVLTLISNDGVDAITSTFTGLAEGASITKIYNGQSCQFTISYLGGSGNDVILTVASVTAAENYTGGNWTYNKSFTLNTTSTGINLTGSDLINFPVLIRLNPSNFIFSQAKSDGTDIRFAKEDGTHIPYEIESWDLTNQTATIWIKVDTLYSGNNTQAYKMYWGYASATDNSSGSTVFPTSVGYAGVWHMNGTTNSSENSLTTTAYGTPLNVNGIVGKAVSFDGTDDNFIVTNAPALDVGQELTVSTWIQATGDDSPNYYRWINRKSAWNAATGFEFAINTNDQQIDMNSANATSVNAYTAVQSLNSGNWHHVVGVWNGTSGSIYIDGVLNTSGTITAQADNDRDIYIGSAAGGSFWIGKLDEVWVNTNAQSADWVKATYGNQRGKQNLVVWDTEDYSTWTYNTKIYLNTTGLGANVSSNVTQVPILISLPRGDFAFVQAQTDGSDIRFAKSDGTHLPYEIERYDDTNDSAEIWVGVDTVYGNNSSQYINMYWGKTGVSSKSSSRDVFNSEWGFEGVYHLTESNAGATGSSTYIDASIQRNTGLDYADATSKVGQVGKGQELDGSNDYIKLGQADPILGNDLTLMAWFKGGDQASKEILSVNNGDNLTLGIDASGYAYFQQDRNSDAGATATSTTVVDNSTWNFIAGVKPSTDTSLLYLNSNTVVKNKSGASTEISTGADYWYIGSNDGASAYLSGQVDEVRIIRGSKSADWIKLNYENQKPNQTLVMSTVYYWDGGGADNKWSTAGNWYPDIVPTSTAKVVFDNHTAKKCSLDVAESIGELQMTSGYTGELKFGSATLTVNGKADFSSGGAITGGSGTLRFTNTGVVLLTGKSGVTWPTIRLSGPGQVSLTGAPFTSTAFTIDGGILDLGDSAFTHTGTLNISSGAIDFGNSTFNVTSGNANFSGLDSVVASIAGTLIFSGSGTQVLTPRSSDTLPNITYTGSGILQFSTNTVKCYHFISTSGGIDFNSQNINSYGNLIITGGSQTSISNLGGRTITVSGSALLSGTAPSEINLDPLSAWTISVVGLLTCDECDLNNSNASGGVQGQASNSTDGGSNTNWNFTGENYSSWTYSKKLYINTTSSGANTTTDVNNFPLLLRFTSSNFTFSQTRNNGVEIRFADQNGLHLNYEIGRWDSTNAKGEIWVLVPQIKGNNKTQYITMYWGNATATTTSDATKVFATSNQFVGVWHLTSTSDATSNGLTVNKKAAGEPVDITNANIAGGEDFDGTDDYMAVANSNLLDLGMSFTASFWMKYEKAATPTGDERILSRKTAWDAASGWEITVKNGSTANLGVLDSRTTGGLSFINTFTTALTDSSIWRFVTVRFDSTRISVYYNGDSIEAKTGQTGVTDNNEQLVFGDDVDYSEVNYNGNLDEVRLEDGIRSADWIKLCYASQKSAANIILTSFPIVSGIGDSAVMTVRQHTKDSVQIRYEVEDPDGGTVTISAQYKWTGGGSWTALTNTAGDIGAGISATNSATDRIISWGARAQLGSSIELNYYVRVIVNDGTNADTTTSSSFKIDTKVPTGPSTLSATLTSSSWVDLGWTVGTDANFSHYEIWYGTNQSDVQNRTGTATEWDFSDDVNMASAATASTRVTGLSGSTTYYFKIWGLDSIGNETTLSDINTTTSAVSPANWSRGSLGNVLGGATTVDAMYVGSASDRLYSLKLTDGSVNWSYNTSSYGDCNQPTYVYTSGAYQLMAASGNYIIGRTDNGTTSSQWFTPINVGAAVNTPYLDEATNAKVWFTYSDKIGLKTIADGLDVAGWPKTLSTFSPSADVVAYNDDVFAVTASGDLYRYDDDGTQLNTISLGVGVSQPLHVQNGVVYVAPQTNRLYAISGSNFSYNWSGNYLTLGGTPTGPIFSIPTTLNLYVPENDKIEKINENLTAASVAWTSASFADSIVSGPIFYGTALYFGRKNGRYYALSTTDGSIKANWPYTDATGHSNKGPWIDITNNQVLFSTTNGDVEAFDLE